MPEQASCFLFLVVLCLIHKKLFLAFIKNPDFHNHILTVISFSLKYMFVTVAVQNSTVVNTLVHLGIHFSVVACNHT